MMLTYQPRERSNPNMLDPKIFEAAHLKLSILSSEIPQQYHTQVYKGNMSDPRRALLEITLHTLVLQVL